MAEPLPDTDQVELTIGGRVHKGWTRISIERGIDAIAGAFSLGVTERWPGQPERQEIAAGDACTVSIGGEIVLTGYVDDVEIQLDGTSHSITVSGRSKAGDLVDASAVAKPGSWSGRSLEAIAGELTKPFGITVTAQTPTAPVFRKFAIEQGETVFAAIERMCRMRGLIPISDAKGNILIVTPKSDAPPVRIAQGKHILSLSAHHSAAERFSTYIVKGQAAGDDTRNGRAITSASAEAKDPGIKRYRPLIVIAEDQVDIATLRKRATYEATVRAAKGQSANVTLGGWRVPTDGRATGGKLWDAMTRVTLDASAAWMTDAMMVAAVAFTFDDGGQHVTLTLARPEAYSQLAVPETAEAGRIRKKAAS